MDRQNCQLLQKYFSPLQPEPDKVLKTFVLIMSSNPQPLKMISTTILKSTYGILLTEGLHLISFKWLFCYHFCLRTDR